MLCLFDVETYSVPRYFSDTARTSSITHLALVHHNDSGANVWDTHKILRLPKALVSLSIYLNDCNPFREDDVLTAISNAEIWSALKWHQDSIKHLDIYRNSTPIQGSPPFHSEPDALFGQLRASKRLSHLSIQPEVLLGGCCGARETAFRLRDTLPPSIESLTFYGDEGLMTKESFSEQLLEVLHAAVDFPCLRSIVLEDVSHVEHLYDVPVRFPHCELARVCNESEVDFRIQRGRELSKGGLHAPDFSKDERVPYDAEDRLREWEDDTDGEDVA